MGDAECERLFLQLVAEHEARGGDGVAGIVDLMAPIEPWQRQVEQPRLGLKDEASLLLVHVEVAAGDMERRAELFGTRLDHVERLALLAADNARHAPLQDARLLGGDRGEAFAEKTHMIDRDRRDCGRKRLLDHIGGVEPAAESGFEQQQVRRRLGEGKEGGSRRDLEQRNELAAICGFGARQAVDEMIFADGRAMAVSVREHDALVKVDEMRRGIDVDTRSLRFGDSAQEGDERALAVGAGDVDDRRQPLLWRAQRSKQPLDAAKRKIDGFRVQRLQAIEQRRACLSVEARRARLPAIG